MEKTLFLIKPDAVARGLVGEIVAVMEREGFVLERLELQRFERAKVRRFRLPGSVDTALSG